MTRQEGRNRINNALVLVKQAIERYGFLARHSRVLVGVSGGVDSTVLIALLHEYNIRFDQKWQLHACHVDAGITPYDLGPLSSLLDSLGIELTIIRTKLKIRPGQHKISPCYRCSRLRRQKLLEKAESLNIFEIVLAHHKQDVAETLFLNMMYNGEISTLVPKQSVIQGRHFFVRPLYYFEKSLIETIAQCNDLPVITMQCSFFKDSKREKVRSFLQECKKSNPDVYKNIFRGITHIKRTYLP